MNECVVCERLIDGNGEVCDICRDEEGEIRLYMAELRAQCDPLPEEEHDVFVPLFS